MKRIEATRTIRLTLAGLILVVAGLIAFLIWRDRAESAQLEFDGDLAYQHVLAQMDFGPRITGSPASIAAGDYIAQHLSRVGWTVEFQTFTYRDTSVRNVIARANVGEGPIIIMGAHYDSRRRADRDPARPLDSVPGANDGASGVAVLLELARTLDLQKVPREVWLAFFDAEDNGELDGWGWIVGSTYMAERLAVQPQAMLLLDMVGDADQQFYFDANSDPLLSEQMWAAAHRLGYERRFIPERRWAMLDDHIPFAQRGIPALDIIDFDYPYWHTTEDTADKVSPISLEIIGRTVKAYLESLEP
jgi:Zn-dependent M28 family amino/carboxypeptidase